MKVKIQIKSWHTGNVLFELETENNTIAKTLNEAVKSRADLTGADLSGAYLSRADLTGAYLTGADLSGAYLSRADLTGADLTRAYLTGAYLTGAYLTGANLTGADLTGADLTRANLSGANLSGANLFRADLSGADLSGAENADHVIAQTLIVGEGDVIGWKKCKDNLIVKLLIPKEAKRHNATGRKCRAEFADVLEITDPTNKQNKPAKAVSKYDEKIIYEVGKRIIPDKYEPNRMIECAGGIHFFITEIEAINYNE